MSETADQTRNERAAQIVLVRLERRPVTLVAVIAQHIGLAPMLNDFAVLNAQNVDHRHLKLDVHNRAEAVVTAIGHETGYAFEQSATPPIEQLCHFLRSKNMLLVLDNFEQLTAHAPLITTLLQAAPALKILTTSRESLRLQEETIYHVHGMLYPQTPDVTQPETYEAVQLFKNWPVITRLNARLYDATGITPYERA